MVPRTHLASLLVLLALASALVGCDGPLSPSPVAGGDATAGPAGLDLTPSPAPSAPASPQELPAGTVALVGVGSAEEPQLYALAVDGSSTPLGLKVTPSSLASPDGRWVVRLEPAYLPQTVALRNLVEGTTHTVSLGVDCASGLCIVGHWAFDRDGARLAFLEVGAPEGHAYPGYPWAIVVVSLQDGSSLRFEATSEGDEPIPPGIPLGWATTGELLLATFRPYTEAGWYGVLALNLPAGAAPAPIESLSPRQVLPFGAGNSVPRLSPDGRRLLYLARDPGYRPDDYHPIAYDLAVNQLWSLEVAGGRPELLVNVTDGGALGPVAAWSPDGAQVLYAEGRYAGDDFGSLTLKARDASGTTRDVGPLPRGHLQGLDGCGPDLALLTTSHGCCLHRLYTVDLAEGHTTLAASAPYISVLGCVR